MRQLWQYRGYAGSPAHFPVLAWDNTFPISLVLLAALQYGFQLSIPPVSRHTDRESKQTGSIPAPHR
jgi:hypothetical protein